MTRLPNTLGIVGTDTLFEGPPEIVRQLRVGIVGRLSARFAIGARGEEAAEVADRLTAGEALNWATSNPRQLTLVADRLGFGLGEVLCVGGSVESALDDDPGLDAVFDIVSSGRTMEAAGLKIVRDNVGRIALTQIYKAPGGG